MQLIDDGSDFADTREDKQTALAIRQRAFDVAHAEAAALATEPSAAAPESTPVGGAAPANPSAKICEDERTAERLSSLQAYRDWSAQLSLERAVATMSP